MPDNIEIKQARESDISVIEGIMLDVIAFLDEIGEPQWRRESVTWEGLSRNFKIYDFYIAYLDGAPAGCMAIVDYDPVFWEAIGRGESLFIHKLAVKRFAAKRGVSRALIIFAKEKSREAGIGEVRLDSHAGRAKVRALYESEGFSCVGEGVLFGKYHTAFYVWKDN